MPPCMQLGATDFGSTSDLADPEGMPNSTVQGFIPSEIDDGGTRGLLRLLQAPLRDGFFVNFESIHVVAVDTPIDMGNKHRLTIDLVD